MSHPPKFTDLKHEEGDGPVSAVPIIKGNASKLQRTVAQSFCELVEHLMNDEGLDVEAATAKASADFKEYAMTMLRVAVSVKILGK